jgi:transcription elongation factor GreB
MKRIEAAVLIDPEAPRPRQAAERVFFGATVRYADAENNQHTVSIVGIDEVDLARNHISWVSPLGRALMKAAEGDEVTLRAPSGATQLNILEIRYERITVKSFEPPPGAESTPSSNAPA